MGGVMDKETPAATVRFQMTSSSTYRTFTWQRSGSRWGSGFISLFEPQRHTVYPFSPFLSFVFNCGKGNKSCLQPSKRRKKPKNISFQLHWPEDTLFLASLQLLFQNLIHNAPHYIHSEGKKERLDSIDPSLLLWKPAQQFTTGCNSTQILFKNLD